MASTATWIHSAASGATAQAPTSTSRFRSATIPRIAAVGLTEAQATEEGIDAATATVDLVQAIARPYI